MTVVNLTNRRLPNKPTQQNRNGILINAFRFNDDKLDCAIGGNINAYQYTYPDTPKIYRFIHSKPNLEFKIQNRNKIDEELDGTPIWGSIEWVNPDIIGRKLQFDEEGAVIFESVNWYVMDYNPPKFKTVVEDENE